MNTMVDSAVVNSMDSIKETYPNLFMYYQTGFDVNNQNPLNLTVRCKSAVSTNSDKLNSECHAKCMGMENHALSEADFYQDCMIDERLYRFSIDDEVSGVEYVSRCFSSAAPSAEAVALRFDVEYPGVCQLSCQESADCGWFTVARSHAGVHRCLHFSNASIATDIVLASHSTRGKRYCDSVDGELGDCSFGAAVCLVDPRTYLTFADELVADISSEQFEVISGPKFCSQSSPDLSTDMCTALYGTFRTAKDTGYDSSLLDVEWNGLYRLFGAGSLIDEKQWNNVMADGAKLTSTGLTDINIVLNELETEIVSSVKSARGE